jgi:hypothetical protein
MTLLPPGFAALEPFAETLAGATAAERAHLRDTISRADAQAFYDAARPLVEQALDYLDATPLDRHDEAERRLMRLVLTFAHISIGIEIQGEAEPRLTRLHPYMRLTQAPADRA